MPPTRSSGAPVVAGLVVLALLPACAAGPGRDGRDGRGSDRGIAQPRTVACSEMLAFMGVEDTLPGVPECRRSDGIDTSYEAELTASPDDVGTWLTALDPGAVLGETCAGGADRCVQVRLDPDGPGDAHFVDVTVTGVGPDAAVSIVAYTT